MTAEYLENHLFVIPWFETLGFPALPKAYSAHGHVIAADDFIRENAPVGMYRLPKTGQFSVHSHLIAAGEDRNQGVMNALAQMDFERTTGAPLTLSLPQTMFMEFEGAAIIDLNPLHPLFSLVEQAERKEKKNGILFTKNGDEEHYQLALEIEKILLKHRFIVDPHAAGRVIKLASYRRSNDLK